MCFASMGPPIGPRGGARLSGWLFDCFDACWAWGAGRRPRVERTAARTRPAEAPVSRLPGRLAVGLLLIPLAACRPSAQVHSVDTEQPTVAVVDELVVTIEHYTHAGCSVGGKHYLPAFADTGLAETFRYPDDTDRCLDTINWATAACEIATHFRPSVEGRLWLPGEKDARCLAVFRQEIPWCIAHYEAQRSKCLADSVVAGGGCDIELNGSRHPWRGPCINGIASGPGSAGVADWQVVGYAVDGRLHGQGTYMEPNGALYEGEFTDGKAHGRGVSTLPDGSRYEGGWRHNRKHGRGVFTWPSGARYEGRFVDGARAGEGTYSWSNGDRYEGEWEEDRRTGRGTMAWSTGDRYEGEWLNDRKHGRGVYSWSSGARYEGEWLEDQRTGQGAYTHADGRLEEGEWRNDTLVRPAGQRRVAAE